MRNALMDALQAAGPQPSPPPSFLAHVQMLALLGIDMGNNPPLDQERVNSIIEAGEKVCAFYERAIIRGDLVVTSRVRDSSEKPGGEAEDL